MASRLPKSGERKYDAVRLPIGISETEALAGTDLIGTTIGLTSLDC